jgi:hypothetical protein
MSKKSRDLGMSVAAGMLTVALGVKLLFFPGCGKSGQDLALQEIAKAGGSVQVDESAPDRPVVSVDFDGLSQTGLMTSAPLGDDGLAHVQPYLAGLPRLRRLRIASLAMISDAGLRHLEGLTQLETLELYGDRITAAGVERLRKQLPNVQIHYSGPGGHSSLFPCTPSPPA